MVDVSYVSVEIVVHMVVWCNSCVPFVCVVCVSEICVLHV